MSDSDDPMVAVLHYVDAFNNGDAKAMAATCADPMQILDGMSPHVWQGPTASEDWWADVLAEGDLDPACWTRLIPDFSRGKRDDPTRWQESITPRSSAGMQSSCIA